MTIVDCPIVCNGVFLAKYNVFIASKLININLEMALKMNKLRCGTFIIKARLSKLIISEFPFVLRLIGMSPIFERANGCKV